MDRSSKILSRGCWAAMLFLACAVAAAEEIRLAQHTLWESNDPTLIDPRGYQECLRSEDTAEIALGRIAFNSPRLLGGQAGRMGLNCNSCHVAGRDNPRFFIQQVSAEPGSVDLTNAFFSSRGGDKVFNPVSIPDLSERKGLKFKIRQGSAFEQHITNLVQTEFDGQPPPDNIMDALLGYLDALDSKDCNPTRASNDFAGHQSLLHETLGALDTSLASQDRELSTFLIKSFRAQLETIYLNVGKEPEASIDRSLLSLSRDAESLLKELSNQSNYAASIKNLTAKLNQLLAAIEQRLQLTHF